MKKFHILLSVFCLSFYALSQDSNPFISDVSLNKVNVENSQSPTTLELEMAIAKKKDTVYQRLLLIEIMIKELEKRLKDSLTSALKSLPSMVNKEQLEQINRLTNEQEALSKRIVELITENQKLKNSNKDADLKLDSEKTRLTNEITRLESAQTNAETQAKMAAESAASEKTASIVNNTNKWEKFIKSYLQKEKSISPELFKDMKLEIASNRELIKDLDSFQIYATHLSDAANFLYKGIGNFNDFYPNFKTKINAKKYPALATSQKELEAAVNTFLKISASLVYKLDEIKGVIKSESRMNILENWIYYDIALNFPCLEAIINKNGIKHTPLNFDPSNP